jgi:hypothetical protein
MKSVYIMKYFVNDELVMIAKCDTRYKCEALFSECYDNLKLYLDGLNTTITTQFYISYTHKTKDICEVLECL